MEQEKPDPLHPCPTRKGQRAGALNEPDQKFRTKYRFAAWPILGSSSIYIHYKRKAGKRKGVSEEKNSRKANFFQESLDLSNQPWYYTNRWFFPDPKGR
jgi:hypothetical protein